MIPVSVVTGGRTGIGFGIANTLSEAGQKVIVTSRKSFEKPQRNFTLFKGDICSSDGVLCFEEFMRDNDFFAQVLVNNVGHTNDIVDPFCSISDWNKVLSVNLYSAINMVNLCVPMMAHFDYGRIINVASNAGVENSGPVTFTTSKAALVAYTRSIGRVLASQYPHIVANAILPGVVVTPEGHWKSVLENDPDRAKRYLSERCPLQRFGEIDEISSLVKFLASPENSFTHGSIIPIDGGQAKGLMTHTYLN